MGAVLLIVAAVVAVVLIGKARGLGKNKIWGPVTDKLNEQTLKITRETVQAGEKAKSEPKLPMRVGCEFAPGKRTSFDFEVEVSPAELSKLRKLLSSHDEIRKDFERLKDYDKDLYYKIKGKASETLDNEMGEDTIKTDRRIYWGEGLS